MLLQAKESSYALRSPNASQRRTSVGRNRYRLEAKGEAASGGRTGDRRPGAPWWWLLLAELDLVWPVLSVQRAEGVRELIERCGRDRFSWLERDRLARLVGGADDDHVRAVALPVTERRELIADALGNAPPVALRQLHAKEGGKAALAAVSDRHADGGSALCELGVP